MSKRKYLLIALVLAIVIIPAGIYAWLGYSSAQSALRRARNELHGVDVFLHGHKEVDLAAERLIGTKSEIDALDKYHAFWISDTDRIALRQECTKYEKEIEELQANAPRPN